nr:MAG TPA: hypothetical protein [Caudovirales sp. ctNII2]
MASRTPNEWFPTRQKFRFCRDRPIRATMSLPLDRFF